MNSWYATIKKLGPVSIALYFYQQRRLKLIKKDSKDVYNFTKDFYLK